MTASRCTRGQHGWVFLFLVSSLSGLSLLPTISKILQQAATDTVKKKQLHLYEANALGDSGLKGSSYIPSLQSDTSDSSSLIDDNAAANPSKTESNNTESIYLWPPQFRISGISFPTLLKCGQNRTYGEGVGLQPRYQCAGKPYNKFVQRMIAFTRRQLQQSNSTLDWGRRPTIAPPTTTPKKILLIGNSHARQVGQALEWQYREQIQGSPRDLTIGDKGGATALVETFSDTNSTSPGLTIFHVYNHPMVYSQRWQQNLEQEVLGFPISELDAIVMGKFNYYSAEFRKSGQWKTNARYRKAHPEQDVDMVANPTAFSLEQLAQVYAGPIVSMSMFSLAGQETHQENLQTIGQLTERGRTNLHHINARRHIENLGEECSSNESQYVASCTESDDAHRCMGNNGGLPDLVAWDLVETLHSIL